MRSYNPGKWNLRFIFTLRGSVFPKGLAWAIPSALAALIIHIAIRRYNLISSDGTSLSVSQVWSGYNFVLSFLIVFRTQQAYSRFWEAAALMQQVRGEWFNAASSLVAFCNPCEKMKSEVEKFQQVLVRLMSLLHCAGLQQVAVMEDENFETIDICGMDTSSFAFLDERPEKCEVILQWVQRLIVNGMSSNVLPVPAPVITRVFQELSRGFVNINNARKITEIPFPFPYAQIVTVMLLMHTVITPLISSIMINDAFWSMLLTFMAVFALWSVNYIAAEIEMPFGDDPNDLPLPEMQRGFNQSLITLLEPLAQQPPAFEFASTRTNGSRRSRCSKCSIRLSPMPLRKEGSKFLGSTSFPRDSQIIGPSSWPALPWRSTTLERHSEKSNLSNLSRAPFHDTSSRGTPLPMQVLGPEQSNERVPPPIELSKETSPKLVDWQEESKVRKHELLLDEQIMKFGERIEKHLLQIIEELSRVSLRGTNAAEPLTKAADAAAGPRGDGCGPVLRAAASASGSEARHSAGATATVMIDVPGTLDGMQQCARQNAFAPPAVPTFSSSSLEDFTPQLVAMHEAWRRYSDNSQSSQLRRPQFYPNRSDFDVWHGSGQQSHVDADEIS